MNVTARLEAEAPAGGIVVSSHVHDAVVGRLKASFRELGALELVAWNAADWQISSTASPTAVAAQVPSRSQLLLRRDSPASQL